MFDERLRLIEGAPGASATAFRDGGRCSPSPVHCQRGRPVGAAARSLFGRASRGVAARSRRAGVEVEFVDATTCRTDGRRCRSSAQAVSSSAVEPMQSLVRHRRGSSERTRRRVKVVLTTSSTPFRVQWVSARRRRDSLAPNTSTAGLFGGRSSATKHRRPGAETDAPHRPAMSAQRPGAAQGLRRLWSGGLATPRTGSPSFQEVHPAVRWVRYLFPPSHPQHDPAKRQMSGGGTVVTFELPRRGALRC